MKHKLWFIFFWNCVFKKSTRLFPSRQKMKERSNKVSSVPGFEAAPCLPCTSRTTAQGCVLSPAWAHRNRLTHAQRDGAVLAGSGLCHWQILHEVPRRLNAPTPITRRNVVQGLGLGSGQVAEAEEPRLWKLSPRGWRLGMN